MPEFVIVIDTSDRETRIKSVVISMCSMGEVLIGGKSFIDIIEGDEYSDEDIASLGRHLRQRRPHLAKIDYPIGICNGRVAFHRISRKRYQFECHQYTDLAST